MKDKAIQQYKQDVNKIWVMGLPWLPDGVKITVNDADKYTKMKNDIMDKMLAVPAPLLSEADKLGVWA
ncbi:hypothetical protein, partial [Nemorincola caseinilytica]|uniref:hypothetical protein n=1 Tax=Nemorincola caseinilytica TaxID=2054315 RepID=UPI0031EAAB01